LTHSARGGYCTYVSVESDPHWHTAPGVLPGDPCRGFSLSAIPHICVTDQSECRSALRFVKLALSDELNAREQGLVDNKLAARAATSPESRSNRRLFASCYAELGDRSLFSRCDDLAKLSRLNQSGLADVPIIYAAFFNVLTNVFDSDHGAMIVLLHVQYTNLSPCELDEAPRNVRDGIKSPNENPVDERDI
jgi:hypothetical protein